MVIIVTLVFTVVMMLYFGVIRLLDRKKKEFLQFLVLYMFALLCIVFISYVCISYIFARDVAGENSHLNFHPVRDQIICTLAFYFPPTFVISYLLYPFKAIKRNRILIWVLLGYTLVVVGGGALLSILVSFSNM